MYINKENCQPKGGGDIFVLSCFISHLVVKQSGKEEAYGCVHYSTTTTTAKKQTGEK